MTATPPSHNLSVPLILSLCGAIMASCGHRPPPLRTNTPTAHPQSAASALVAEAKSEPNPDPQTTTLAEPNYGNALVVRARDFPDGLSGTIMCEGFVIPAGEFVVVSEDLVVESTGPIIIEGDLFATVPASGLNGASITLESMAFIRLIGIVRPGEGMTGTELGMTGGDAGDLVLRAPYIQTTLQEIEGVVGGAGAPAGRGGRGGDIVLSGDAILVRSFDPPEAELEFNLTIISGAGGAGGDGTTALGNTYINGGHGGDAGNAIAGDFEPADWMMDRFVQRANGTPGTPGSNVDKSNITNADGDDASKACGSAGFGKPGPRAIGKGGGHGGNGSAATHLTAAGVGGNGGAGGDGTGGNGGDGGRGGDCCGPAPRPSAQGGSGGRGGDGGAGVGGDGGNGGTGGAGSQFFQSGGAGGHGGNTGQGQGGNAGNGGDGGHGVPGGSGLGDGTPGASTHRSPGSGGAGGARHNGQGSDGPDGNDGNANPGGIGLNGSNGHDGQHCDIAYADNNSQAYEDDPSGNGFP